MSLNCPDSSDHLDSSDPVMKCPTDISALGPNCPDSLNPIFRAEGLWAEVSDIQSKEVMKAFKVEIQRD
jgi:hypothetical protein